MVKNLQYAIGIVIYKEGKNFLEKVNLFINQGYIVYIYDNSPSGKFSREYMNKDNIKYYTCGKNIGLSISMSTLCAQAYYDGYDKLLFLDQDTIVSENTLVYIQNVNNSTDFNDYLAISFSNDNLNEVKIDNKNNFDILNVLVVRNSGTLFDLSNLKKINWFDTSYFIDGVDYEFSFNASLYNYKLGLCKNIPDFDHLSEQGYSKYNFFGKKIFYRTYSLLRIKDVTSSSLKLILKSTRYFKFDYSILFFKHWIVFLLLQLIIRLSKKEKNEQ
jgi:GT2 family glycosyltransferase